jgi:hypothetical protein
MNIYDLDKILEEYYKHFGKNQMEQYFESIIKLKKGEKNATSQKKSNGSSRGNIRSNS